MNALYCFGARPACLFYFCFLIGIGYLSAATADVNIDDALSAVETGDFDVAYTQFEELAKSGDAEAQYNLAILFKSGNGVKQDSKKAAKWFRSAADQGLAAAQHHLGLMYDNGIGVEQNYEYAVVWYKKASMQGYALAQTNLGVLYANGQGVAQDVVKAYIWFNLAASQGVREAFNNREIVAEQMTPEMLENMRTLSKEYFQRYVEPFQAHKVPGPHELQGQK